MFKLLLPFLFLSNFLSGQVSHKEIEVQINEHNQFYFVHEIQESETLFSLCRYYKVKMEDVLLINNISELENIPIGSKFTFPFNTDELITTHKRADNSWPKVTYKVREKETLYKIANSYFPQKIENLFSRNRIRSFSLKRGQKLIVGWWDGSSDASKKETNILTKLEAKKREDNPEPKKVPDTPKAKEVEEVVQQTTTTPSTTTEVPSTADTQIGELEQRKRELEDLISQLKRKKQEIEETKLDTTDPQNQSGSEDPGSVVADDNIVESSLDSLTTEDQLQDTIIEEPQNLSYSAGLAYWDKEEIDQTNLLVMHNKAKPGSFIKLVYELTGEEVTAKVISTIPRGLYPDEIDIIISSGVAVALGALDSPFQIEMHYYE